MKKIILTLVTGLCMSALSFANNADIFSYDANKINQEMSELQSLEDFVTVNPGVTLSNLQTENSSLVNDLNLISETYGGIGSFSGEPALGIPSFLWGCILGWVGILIVYLVTDQDKAETKKALTGCIVSSLAGCVVGVVYYVIIIVYYGSYFYY
jgi:hypothetical protein